MFFIDQLNYADTAGGQTLRFLAKQWRKAFDAGDYRKAATVARIGTFYTNCRIWATTATMMETVSLPD